METSTTTTTAADMLRQRAADAEAFARLADDLGVTSGQALTRIALHQMSRADFDAVVGATGARAAQYEGEGHLFWSADVQVAADAICEVYTREAPVEVPTEVNA